jgi:hypothetical protein
MKPFTFLAVFAIASCHGSQPINPPPDVVVGDGGATCESAAANLAVLGCAEAAPGANFLDTCKADGRAFSFRLDCLAAAKSKAEAQACGRVKCP